MCGIVGFHDTSIAFDAAKSIVEKMARSIAHRGPDDEGVWTEAGAGIALAHRRLSIVDLSPAGHQPMTSHNGRLVIVFNGEVYNYAAIRKELDASAQIEWRGHSDTEVLLEAVVRWGIVGALDRCVGMFAFAIWDRDTRILQLARDRLGEKPLYYANLGSTFAFSSELKALRRLPNWSQSIDRNSLKLLIRHGYVPAPYTIFNDVNKLRPGHVLTYIPSEESVNTKAYWSASRTAELGIESPFQGTRDEAVETLERLIRQSLRGQMMADVSLGAFLSGGVDSSTIVALMQSESSQPVQTFTIGFDVEGYNEAKHAKKVAKHLGTNHNELYVTETDALNVIPKLPSIYCEPFSDSSQLPTFLVSQLARQNVTVSLSGDAGDELFSGYTRYAFAEKVWDRISLIPESFRYQLADLATNISPAFYDRFAGPLVSALPAKWQRKRVGDSIHKAASVLKMRDLNAVYLRLCSQCPDPDLYVIGGTEHPTMLTGLDAVPDFADGVERMMYLDLVSYLPDDILVKVDRAAMAVSLETRVPLLDHRIVEFAQSLPLTILKAEGVTKWPLRQILYKYLPKNLIERPKMGFGVPIDKWLRGALREWAEQLLNASRLRREGYFQAEAIRRVWEDHLSGRGNHQYFLWNVLMFQEWLENNGDTTN